MPTSKKETNGLLFDLTSATVDCRLCVILKELPVTERDALMAVIAKMKTKNATKHGRALHTYTYRWLADVLTKHGFAIQQKDVRNYFKKECDC